MYKNYYISSSRYNHKYQYWCPYFFMFIALLVPFVAVTKLTVLESHLVFAAYESFVVVVGLYVQGGQSSMDFMCGSSCLPVRRLPPSPPVCGPSFYSHSSGCFPRFSSPG